MSTAAHAATHLPAPPYYVVVFTSQLRGQVSGYAETAERMLALAAEQAGFLGVHSARGADGFGITVSYWESEEAIRQWRAHAEHAEARRQGREHWYADFTLQVARVERAYGYERREEVRT